MTPAFQPGELVQTTRPVSLYRIQSYSRQSVPSGVLLRIKSIDGQYDGHGRFCQFAYVCCYPTDPWWYATLAEGDLERPHPLIQLAAEAPR